MPQNMEPFSIIRRFARNIVGHLQSTGRLQWVKPALACLFSGLMMAWMKAQ